MTNQNPNSLKNLDKGKWKPGESGNPKGKPKGSKHLSTYIQEALVDENFELKLKDGSILKEMPVKAIIKTAVAKSLSGDTRAMEWLAKHGFGEKHILSNDPESPVGVPVSDVLVSEFSSYLKDKTKQ